MNTEPETARYLRADDHARLVAALLAARDPETVAVLLGEQANVWSDRIAADPQALPACLCSAGA